MNKELSKHAETRSQQRAIPPVIVDWLMNFGTVEHDHAGAEIRYFDKRSRKRLASAVGETVVKRLNDLLDAYLVTRGPLVLTVGHRFKRVGHN